MQLLYALDTTTRIEPTASIGPTSRIETVPPRAEPGGTE